MATIGTPENPLRVAIVGSGPSGFYAAGALFASKSHPDLRVEVDMFDRLPTPWGLVRGGVAPDHPNIKAVSRVYEKIAQQPGFRFYGNVELGRDLFHDDLTGRYHAVIYAVGAQTDRRMGIPGEDLPGSWAATEFVAWYNGHPDYRELEFDLSAECAVVVGNGNVAADVARMLALTPEELKLTDVADHALEALSESKVREIVVLGRRGPAQAAFTNPELLELGDMTHADVYVDPGEAELDPLSRAFIESDAAHGTAKKNVKIVHEYSQRAPVGKQRRIVLRFLVSPLEITGSERVEGIRIGHNELAHDDSGQIRPRPKDTSEEIECGLVFRSIGYRGTPLEGLPFDARRAIIPNDGGRITTGERPAGASIDLPEGERTVPGEYVVGWIKRGPTGIIGTNKRDAQQTVALLLEDVDAGRLLEPADPDREALDALVAERRPDAVSYHGWLAIDEAEKSAGEPHGRPRVKLCTFEELLEAAQGEPARR
jgi:ferredoxin/flavodoxin---NADP+ reductase